LEAAEFICVGDPVGEGTVLDLLAHLVDKSIVVVEQLGTGARYRFLETIRQYGAERLLQSREDERVRALQFDWLFQLADRADHEFSGPDQRAWYERLDVEHDNFRASLQWYLRDASHADRGLRLCNALWRFWQAHGHLTEGRKWLDAFLSHDCAASEPVRARALHGASGLASMQGDFELARAFLEQNLALQRKMNDKQGIAHTLQRLGIIAYYTGDYQRSATLQQESLVLCQEIGDLHGVARALNGLGILALDQGHYKQARMRLGECLAIYRQEGHRLGIMATLNNLGETSQRQGDYDQAERLLQESLSMAHELSDKGWTARALHVLGNVAAGQGRYESATELFEKALAMFREVGDASAVYVLEGMACTAAGRGEAARSLCLAEAAAALRETLKMKRTPADQSALNKYLCAAKRALSVEEARRALASGRAMTLERAVEYALQHE
jgi:tetratricopeptide (TPR) repeat protein